MPLDAETIRQFVSLIDESPDGQVCEDIYDDTASAVPESWVDDLYEELPSDCKDSTNSLNQPKPIQSKSKTKVYL